MIFSTLSVSKGLLSCGAVGSFFKAFLAQSLAITPEYYGTRPFSNDGNPVLVECLIGGETMQSEMRILVLPPNSAFMLRHVCRFADRYGPR